jgi:hypothetical protein
VIARAFAFAAGLLAGAIFAAIVWIAAHEERGRSERALAAFAPEATESWFLDVPGHEVALTHGGRVPTPMLPAGIAALSEPGVRNGLALVAKIRDAKGEVVGFASELEALSSETSLRDARIRTDTFWTLALPGRGTLFLHETEDNWRLATRIVLPAVLSRRDWRGDWTNVNSVGPRGDGRGAVVGGTGEFEGARGSFLEIGRLRRFTPRGEMEFTIELRVAIEERNERAR